MKNKQTNVKLLISNAYVLADSRLTKNQLKVLLTLFLFRDNQTNLCYPSKSTIAQYCGLMENKISVATRDLCELGWLKKSGNGGRSRSATYRVTTPKYAINAYNESQNRTKGEIKPVPKQDLNQSRIRTKTSPETGLGKELTNNYPLTTNVQKGAKGAKNTKPCIKAERFDEWWKAYPKKVNKKKALASWKSRNLDKIADTIIADTLERKKSDGQWLNGYIPHPTTYINGDRWEDEIQKPVLTGIAKTAEDNRIATQKIMDKIQESKNERANGNALGSNGTPLEQALTVLW